MDAIWQTRKLNNSQETVLALLSNALFNAKVPIDCKEWTMVIQECIDQAVLPVAFFNNITLVPDDLQKSLQTQLHTYIANNMQVSYEHTELHKLLLRNGIRYVTLKGNTSAAYYPNPIERTMGDVDFLVEKKDIDKVSCILEKYGFYHPRGIHPTEKAYYRDGKRSTWELHWGINGVPDNESGKIIQEYLSNIIDTAELVSSSDGSYMAPDIFHHGLVMIIHCGIHMTSGGIGLRHLCDWAVYVDRFSDDEFCQMFEEPLQEMGLWKFAKLLTQLSMKYLHCSEKKWAGKANDSFLEQMIQDIFDGGNFGHKDSVRDEEGALITNQSNGKIEHSVLKQAFMTANQIVRDRWPMARQVVILYPIGWLYWGIRYFILMSIGKKKRLHIRKMITGANQRKKIYKELGLFELK